MNSQLQDLIDTVQKNPSELGPKMVLADRLIELGDPRGESIALDLALRDGLGHAEARQALREAREKVWQRYGLDTVPEYLLQDHFWMGSFPLRFPNKDKLKELDGVFVEEFPHYELLSETQNYALGVHQLRKHCEAQEKSLQPQYPQGNDQTIYRPFTFRENILARVEDYWTFCDISGKRRSDDDRLQLFNRWLDSCTGIAYKANSPKFKIILQSPHLIGIRENFDEETITEDLTGGPLNYDSLDRIELDRNHGIYRQLLTQEQVLDHPAWNAALEEDKPLLKEHANIVYSKRKGNNMGFWPRDDIEEDQLRVLFVSNLNDNSNAYGDDNLDNGGFFLRR